MDQTTIKDLMAKYMKLHEEIKQQGNTELANHYLQVWFTLKSILNDETSQ